MPVQVGKEWSRIQTTMTVRRYCFSSVIGNELVTVKQRGSLH
ncbi:hypothetical protein [Desulforamulus ferrireducens]|nr:hypothetical protein [Desulforamulus ferrireducens]